jgi:Dyp-type peroxidase family
MQSQIEFEDIQAHLLTGYGRLPLARYVFLRIGDREEAKHWLGELAGEITTEAEIRRSMNTERKLDALHIAFTADGLRALGFPETELRASFPREFVEGMSKANRARILGDTGRSDPRCWEFGGSGKKLKQEDIHLVLMLFSMGTRQNRRWLEQFHARHRVRYIEHELEEMFLQDTFLMKSEEGEGFKEWFGFREGIAEPVIEGDSPPSTQGQFVKPGEFILGYENTHGQKSLSPTVPADWDAGNHLPDAAPDSSRKDLGCNGSYMVIRKLWQNTEAFERFLNEHGEDTQERELLAAKLMGRWRSGAPLSLCPEKDDKQLARDGSRNNCFAYAQDPHGMLCPLGSHIRRSNPRDALIPGDREASLQVVARHQLIRRGRLYDDGGDEKGVPRRGTFFVVFNANLRSQFEFIQHSWLNNPKFEGHYDSKDPIAGDNPDASTSLEPGESPPEPCSVTIPEVPVSRRIEGLTRFVEVRGGGYFFLPGIKALRFLSALQAPVVDVAGSRASNAGLEMPALASH